MLHIFAQQFRIISNEKWNSLLNVLRLWGLHLHMKKWLFGRNWQKEQVVIMCNLFLDQKINQLLLYETLVCICLHEISLISIQDLIQITILTKMTILTDQAYSWMLESNCTMLYLSKNWRKADALCRRRF